MGVSESHQPPIGKDQNPKLAPILERTKKHGMIDHLLPSLCNAGEPALDLVHQER